MEVMRINKQLMRVCRAKSGTVRRAFEISKRNREISRRALRGYITAGCVDETDNKIIEHTLWVQESERALAEGRVRRYQLQEATPEMIAEEERLKKENPLLDAEKSISERKIVRNMRRGLVAVLIGLAAFGTNRTILQKFNRDYFGMAASGLSVWNLYLGNSTLPIDLEVSLLKKYTDMTIWRDGFFTGNYKMNINLGQYSKDTRCLESGKYVSLSADLHTRNWRNLKNSGLWGH